jgi:hypothetical protein
MVLDNSRHVESESDVGEGEDEDYDEEKDESSAPTELTTDLDNPRGRQNQGLGKRLHISNLLQMVLQDAQTRLFFKAQAVVQSEVRYYQPQGEDLRWPDVLIGGFQFLVLGCPSFFPRFALSPDFFLNFSKKKKGTKREYEQRHENPQTMIQAMRSGRKRVLARCSGQGHWGSRRRGIQH